MDDLIAFLRARLDEREQREVATDPPLCECSHGLAVHPTSGCVNIDCECRDYTEAERWDDGPRPDPYVLADIESKRRILEVHGPAWSADNPDDCWGNPQHAKYCGGCNFNGEEEWAYTMDECPTKRLLALPFADHPDYREDWRP